MKHTELPWTAVKDGELVYVASENYDICDLYHIISDKKVFTKPNAEANAEFIEKAVNNHYQLLEALNELMSSYGGGKKSCGHDFTCSCAWDKAKEAIKEAL